MAKEDDLQRQIDEVDKLIETAQRKRRKLRARLVELQRTARAKAKAEFDKTRPQTMKERQLETGFLTAEQARDKCWDVDIDYMSIIGICKLARQGVLRGERYGRWFIDPQSLQEFIDRNREDDQQ